MNPASISHISERSNISRRFTIISIMFFCVLLALLVFTITTLQKDKSTALLIDMAGRQRMLLQKHMNDVLLTSQGVPADYLSTRELLHSTLTALTEGGTLVVNPETDQRQTVSAAPSQEIFEQFREQQEHIEHIFQLADHFLLLSPDPLEFQTQLQALRTQHSLAIRTADEAVKQLNNYSQATLSTMIQWEILIAILLGLLGMFVTIKNIRDGRKLQKEVKERNRAESALRDSELFLNSIVENIPHMIFVKDAKDLRFVRWNKAGEELVGYPKEALTGKNDYDFFPKSEADLYTQKDREVLSSKTLIDIPEEVLHTESQETRYLHTKKIPILDPHGTPLYLLGISEDITELRQAEKVRQESEKRLQAILDNSSAVIYLKDLEGRFLLINKSFERIFHLDRDWVKGKTDLDIFPLDVAEAFRANDQKALQLGPAFEKEELAPHEDGMHTYISNKFPLLTAEGVPYAICGVSTDITERKQAEELIRKGERKFRAIYEQAPTGIAILDSISGRFTQINQRYCDIVGYSEEEMLDLTFSELAHPEDLQADLHQMQQLLAGRINRFQMEKRSFRKNGAVIWVNLICVPLWLEPTDPRQHMAMVEDITYRKQGEKALQDSEERFRSLYEDNPSMYFTVAQDGTVLSVNQFGAQQLGYTVEELVGQPVIGLFIEDDKPFVRQRFADCLTNPLAVFSWEFRKVRKDKSIVWVKEGVRAVHNQDGELVVLFVCEDISERKETEKALQASKTMTESVLRQLPKGFAYRCLNDKNWTAVYVSDGIEEVTGIPASDLLSGKINYNSLLAPDENERVWANVQEALVKQIPYENEHQITTSDGTTKWVLARGRFIFDDAGKLLYLDGLNVDITERKQTEERLRESEAKRLDALRQSDELKSALLSSVSHELRTPLTAMKTSVSNIMGYMPNDVNGVQERALKEVDKEINYMSRLVDNLLDMSQIEAGTLTPHREWHLLEDLVEVALRRTAQSLDSRNIEIDIPENVPPIFVDAVQMQQILINLLDNAGKYSSPSSPIRIYVRVEAQQITVETSNMGKPIQPQELERLFDRFYRRRSPHEQSIRGTGLGLAICKGIIEAHGGRIWAESTEKEVTITFTIPAIESMANFSLEGLQKR